MKEKDKVNISQFITKDITFSNRRKDYEVGDTINIALDSGEIATYTLTEIT